MEHCRIETSSKSKKLTAREVVFDNSIRRVEYEDLVDWDLFPYKIKNRSLFYDREHPKQVNPLSFTFNNYWEEFSKKSVEGHWVNDEGTWVFMMPKLFFYINYMKILGNSDGNEKDREFISPDLSSLEWISFSYILIGDGFSGFKGDENYTCNNLVKRIFDGEDLNKYDLEDLKNNCYNKKGDLKIYVDPWEYLTRFYTLDNPSNVPLGKALYENRRGDLLVSGSRGVAKSFVAYGGDFMHEWTFGGITDYNKKDKCSTRLLYSMVSGAKDALNRSAGIISSFYDSQPGKYKYPDPDRPDFMGPFYKNKIGTWKNGGEIKHIVKTKGQANVLNGSELQISVVTPDRKRVGAGDRFRRMYVEEGGLIEYITEIHSTNKDSLEIGKNKVGSAYITGTAGDLKAIEGMKKMILNPKGYQIVAIPNYWKNAEQKSIALFISAIYKYRSFKDPKGGNNDLLESLQYIYKERQLNAEIMDSASFDDYVLNAPISPDEMLRPNRRSFLPTKEAQNRTIDIEDYNLLDVHLTAGDLVWDSTEKYGVGFKKDRNSRREPILKYNIDRSKMDITGQFSIFEHPQPGYIPDGLYWVLFDPVSKPGKGETLDSSLNVAFVYKYFYTGDENTLEDSIVAEWIGREDELEDSYERVIKLAKYYNARIFPETNTPGFVDYCKRSGYYNMLQEEAYIAEKEINPNYRKRGAVGYSIYGEKKKPWLMLKLKSWLLRKRGVNPETGNFHSRNIEHILSTRFLDEIENYNETSGNYDYISAALGLMLLLEQFREEPIELKKESELVEYTSYEDTAKPLRRRSSFENSMY